MQARDSAPALSPLMTEVLGRQARSRTAAGYLVERSRIVLGCASGGSNTSVARDLGVNWQRVRRWRRRWNTTIGPRVSSLEAEGVADEIVFVAIEEGLSDRPRSGAPRKFTDEEEARVISLACRTPSEFGLPHSQWTLELLAGQAVEQRIVRSISIAELGRWLQKGGSSRTGHGTG